MPPAGPTTPETPATPASGGHSPAAPRLLADRIEAALTEIIAVGDEAKARGYELPPAAANGVVMLNVMATVIRGQETGQAPTLAEQESALRRQLDVPDVAALRALFAPPRP